MTSGSVRPSEARRNKLKDGLSVPLVSNFFQLDRYYDAADKVYQSFQLAYDTATQGDIHDWNPQKDACLDDAYVYGKRYCTFCIEQLPRHDYYGTTRYKHLQKLHKLRIKKVIDQIEKIAEQMDFYEEVKRKAAEERQRLEEYERDRAHQERLAAFQARFKEQRNEPTTKDKSTIAASAFDKLKNIQRFKGDDRQSNPSSLPRDQSSDEPLGMPSTKYSMLSDDDDEEVHNEQDLPVALLQPALPFLSVPPSEPLPPSYDQAFGAPRIHSTTPESGFINGMNVLGDDTPLGHGTSAPLLSYHAPSEPSTKHLSRKSTKKVPLETLQMQCESEYKKFVKEGKITVTPLATYQGRDSVIVHVIDRQCGPLLNEIRSKLGLSNHALIIPSDVHDHLVDHKLLPQDKFLGVAGGNILDSQHLSEFLKLLAQARNKAGATLFFREHVISLVKYYDKNGNSASYTYDLIDSMPTHNGKATRTRCNGLDALQVLVRWYASRKFSPSDCRHVDRNEWEDNLADVDPRVFQGFVWGDAPQ